MVAPQAEGTRPARGAELHRLSRTILFRGRQEKSSMKSPNTRSLSRSAGRDVAVRAAQDPFHAGSHRSLPDRPARRASGGSAPRRPRGGTAGRRRARRSGMPGGCTSRCSRGAPRPRGRSKVYACHWNTGWLPSKWRSSRSSRAAAVGCSRYQPISRTVCGRTLAPSAAARSCAPRQMPSTGSSRRIASRIASISTARCG